MARKKRRRGTITVTDPNSSNPQSEQTIVADSTSDNSTFTSDDCGGAECPPDHTACGQTILGAVDSNTQLLEQLLDQVADLRGVVQRAREQSALPWIDEQNEDVSEVAGAEHAAGEEDQSEHLRQRIAELEYQVGELEQQNSDLASQVASTSVRKTVADVNSDALSWEERKQLILQQMEEDSFDAEEFVSSLSSESETEIETPADFIDHMQSEIEKRDSEIARRDDELNELRFVLEQQSETRSGGVAIGAAAIAEMIDSDELVLQERERLQLLQAEWEEKFRQGEIEASLERAKLSRERQELAQKQAELEEQLEHLRRESRQSRESGNSSRRWMVKLGLSDDDDK